MSLDTKQEAGRAVGGTRYETRSIAHRAHIKAAAALVFPLACPVLEYRWIPGWKCKLLHCPSGRVEAGCTFREIFSAPFLLGRSWGFTTWTAVLYDAAGRCVHYRLENAISSSLYCIEIRGHSAVQGEESTELRLDFSYTPTHARGEQLLQDGGERKIRFMLGALAAMMKHYAETGRMITLNELGRARISPRALTGADRARLLLNRIAMKLLRDPDRRTFLAGGRISRTLVTSTDTVDARQ